MCTMNAYANITTKIMSLNMTTMITIGQVMNIAALDMDLSMSKPPIIAPDIHKRL